MEEAMGSTNSEVGHELARQLADPATRPQEIADRFDALDHAERVAAVRSFGRAAQRSLYELVDGFRPLRLEHLVPPSAPDFTQVRHYGRNTLPAFKLFEKRFCRPPGADAVKPGELHGFNFQTMSPVTGPGYFVAREDTARPEVLVDYNFVPKQHPEGWPEIRPNEQGLSRFVYGFMVDTLRGVSQHVTIGSAARRGKDMGSWFILCREA
jgi:hypothetical protein